MSRWQLCSKVNLKRYARLQGAMSQSGPKPKCHDLPFGRDGVQSGHKSDIAKVKRMTRLRHWLRDFGATQHLSIYRWRGGSKAGSSY